MAIKIFGIEPELKRKLKISFFVHLVLLLILLLSPSGSVKRTPREGIYRVSLKSIPVGISGEVKSSPTEITAPVSAPRTEKIVNIPEAKKESLTKKSKSAQEAIQQKQTKKAVSEKEKKKKETLTTQEDILAMINSARKELSTSGSAQTKGSVEGESSIITGASLSGTAKEYYDSVEQKIKNEWVLPGAMAQEAKKLKTVIGIIIKRDGSIDKIWVEESSGNIYYDRAALRAVKKASPLPPIPAQMPDKTLEIGIIF